MATNKQDMIPSGLNGIMCIKKPSSKIPDREWNSVVLNVPYEGSFISWDKAYNSIAYNFQIIEKPAEALYTGQYSHVDNFGINTGVYDAQYVWAPFVDLNNNSFCPEKDYVAGVTCNLTEEENISIQGVRPMTKKEILTFYRNMYRALRDFPDEEKSTVAVNSYLI